MRRNSLLMVSAVVLAAMGIAGCGRAAPQSARPAASTTAAQCASGAATITAHGTGTASQAPDLLTLVAGVTTTGASAAAALSDNNHSVQAVLTQLRGGGVAAPDLQTSDLSIQPLYSNTAIPYITGYQVSDTISAKLRQRSGSTSWSAAGSVIDAVAAAAGNAIRLQDISFSVEHDGGLVSLARASAVRQAIAQADSMAQAANVQLGALCSISDAPSTPLPDYLSNQVASAASGGAGSVPLAPGSQRDTAQVTVVYASPA